MIEKPSSDKEAVIGSVQLTSQPSEVLKVVLRMFTYYPVWDISWLIAFIFTWGSIVWCINGFFSFLPFIRPSSEFPGEVLDGGGITAFIGAVIFFEFGSVLLMFEAINENKAGCFGWAVEELVTDDGGSQQSDQIATLKSRCHHHHRNRKNFVGKGVSTSNIEAEPENENAKDGKSWQWFPSWSSLKNHYSHELGFLASLSQFCGATVFSIAGFTALPGINNKLSQGLLDGIYWAPQVVGGLRLHHLRNLVHARDAEELVHSFIPPPWLAHCVLELNWRDWFHALWCPRSCICQSWSAISSCMLDLLGLIRMY